VDLKAVRLIARDPAALANDERAMLELGLGKNMVRALRFWLESFGVAASRAGRWTLVVRRRGVRHRRIRSYIERAETQWLLHWQLSTQVQAPLFAWRHILYRRMRPDFTRSELLAEMRTEGERLGFDHSDVTLLQHADIFLHTYAGSTTAMSPEDALDGPLVDLGLLRRAGVRDDWKGYIEGLIHEPILRSSRQ
jgi:hypothetical protein